METVNELFICQKTIQNIKLIFSYFKDDEKKMFLYLYI